MSEVYAGPRTWTLKVDEEGYREYSLTAIVKGTTAEGPFSALRAAAERYPIGSPWVHINDDFDEWATRRPQTVITIHEEKEGDPSSWYAVEMIYTNKPSKTGRCDGDEVNNPLCLPDRVSGRFVKYVEEAVSADAIDYFTDGVLVRSLSGGEVPIRNSAHEQIKGPGVEFERNRQRIVIEQNVLNLELDLLAELIDSVNDASLWGFPNSTVKLSDVSWSKHYYGTTTNVGANGTGTGTGTDNCPDYTGCYSFFKRVLEFDIDARSFDRTVFDEGTKVLNGHWSDVNSNEWVLDNIDGAPPDPENPAHFCDAKDRNDNLIRVVLSGEGLPTGADVGGTTQGIGTIEIYKYPRKNLLQLGIPTEIE